MFSKTKTAAIACAALAFTAGCADASSSRGRLLQQVQPVQSVTALDTVEGLIPQRIKIDPYIDFMPLAELEAEAPAFENAPYPRAGVNFAAGPQGDAAPDSQVNEVDETTVVQDDATNAIDNATDLYSWNATDATGLEWNATDASGAANTNHLDDRRTWFRYVVIEREAECSLDICHFVASPTFNGCCVMPASPAGCG